MCTPLELFFSLLFFRGMNGWMINCHVHNCVHAMVSHGYYYYTGIVGRYGGNLVSHSWQNGIDFPRLFSLLFCFVLLSLIMTINYAIDFDNHVSHISHTKKDDKNRTLFISSIKWTGCTIPPIIGWYTKYDDYYYFVCK